ncbi:hypothetical protein Sjap_005644 [Stephania japonica]|uniref:Uncharacterized protein n=1 Tax=Stephania japonica TaxID=461633 RepID=A0AAP0K4E8_9MAGN
MVDLHLKTRIKKFLEKWRVGDGHNIKIWEDAWVTNKRKIFLWYKFPSSIGNVADLIDRQNGTWDVDLIHHLYTEDEATLILATIMVDAFNGNGEQVADLDHVFANI